jgi:retron-type reverse transcriptase
MFHLCSHGSRNARRGAELRLEGAHALRQRLSRGHQVHKALHLSPGVDRQDFEAVEAYGVERWLGELALALRQETYRPDPIRRVFIPKANGKLRPQAA